MTADNPKTLHKYFEKSSGTFLFLSQNETLGEKYPLQTFFWSVFPHIRTENGDLYGKSPYSVRMQENMDQKNSGKGHFSHSGILAFSRSNFPRVFEKKVDLKKFRILSRKHQLWNRFIAIQFVCCKFGGAFKTVSNICDRFFFENSLTHYSTVLISIPPENIRKSKQHRAVMG